ncbi:hypothetical protein HMPREF9436_01942 [Faecalibacterium cf. prausnitzii KLE1255]|uniref:Phosphotyrosine protein phosphatase I domain-containing protein n=1 Tax=Faecalibacterium cf. prausnitzii KLE1255 TaxID=748224 RepID=E2ZJU3_9FIRM|nr:hypothetical protein HMPREF9436_01942 [Faecalibacterium cf. prausnitzii KLE1255]
MSKPKIAFICVHNSCRSQIAEAFGRYWPQMCLKATRLEPKSNRRSIRMLCA